MAAKFEFSVYVQISQKSGAQVNVLPNSDDQSSVCFLLQGTTQQNLLAKCALEKLANDSELITDIIEVPQTAFGRIIGPALSLTFQDLLFFFCSSVLFNVSVD